MMKVHQIYPPFLARFLHFPPSGNEVIGAALVAICLLAILFRKQLFDSRSADLNSSTESFSPGVKDDNNAEKIVKKLKVVSSSAVELSKEEHKLFQHVKIIEEALKAENYWCVLERYAEFHKAYDSYRGDKFTTNHLIKAQKYQQEALEHYTPQDSFTSQMASSSKVDLSQSVFKLDEKRDGNCGYNTWMRIVRFYLASGIIDNFANHRAILDNLNAILPDKNASEFLKAFMQCSEDEARARLRWLIAQYLIQKKDDVEIQLFLDETIKSDVVADLNHIMFEVASEVIRVEGVDEEINKETIQQVLDSRLNMLIKLSVADVLKFSQDKLGYVDYSGDYKDEAVEEKFLSEDARAGLRNAYIEKMQIDRVWMQNLEMMVISEIFRFKVCLVKDDKLIKKTAYEIYDLLAQGEKEKVKPMGTITLFHEDKDFPEWALIHHCDNGSHFEYIVPQAHVHVVEKAEE